MIISVTHRNEKPSASFSQREQRVRLGVRILNPWLPGRERMHHCIDFIPQTRLDDLMVSYAASASSGIASAAAGCAGNDAVRKAD